MADYTFKGWLGHDPSSAKGNMKWESFTPKPFTDDDIDIKVSHCGICGSDLHTLRSGWGKSLYPVCVGHEIVGRAVRVGKKAAERRGVQVGDRVGVGAQSMFFLSYCALFGHELYCRLGKFNSMHTCFQAETIIPPC
jgi:alcohol dehydrogenase (NADP+)